MSYLLLAVLLLALAEIKARRRFLDQHGMTYRAKRIGEYPYGEFIEECGPPLLWRLKPGYAARNMHINSLGQRGPEPQPGRRRIWVVGESELFGAKLPDESRIWFKALQKKLDEAGFDYQVMNASIIGYNGQQTADAVCSLPVAAGDILLVRPSLNDMALARIHGADWQPGTAWSMAFIRQLQRHSPWYMRLLDRSCLGMMLRHRFARDARGKAFAPKPGFQWDSLVQDMVKNITQVADFGQSRGARVALFDIAPVYAPELTAGDRAKLGAIQANWRNFVGEWSARQFQAVEEGVDKVAAPRGLPVLRTAAHIWSHPRRYHLYLDLLHFSAEGHEAMAGAFFAELGKSGLLERDAA